jgi:hypothetical protein
LRVALSWYLQACLLEQLHELDDLMSFHQVGCNIQQLFPRECGGAAI